MAGARLRRACKTWWQRILSAPTPQLMFHHLKGWYKRYANVLYVFQLQTRTLPLATAEQLAPPPPYSTIWSRWSEGKLVLQMKISSVIATEVHSKFICYDANVYPQFSFNLWLIRVYRVAINQVQLAINNLQSTHFCDGNPRFYSCTLEDYFVESASKTAECI